MAQPASDEVASSAQQAASPSHGDGVSSRSATASRTHTPAPSFQAVNAVDPRAPSENAQTADPAAANRRGSSSDLTPPASDAVVAQPASQTPHASTSASQPAKSSPQADAADGTMAETTYGTRSRNRTNARPNYAEDQDMDFEFTSAATTTAAAKKKAPDASLQSGSGASDSKRAPESTSFHAVNAGSASGAKESTSGNSGTVTTGTSKKRKAAGVPAAALLNQSASSTPPPGATRKSTAPASSALARETNVMTFTKHRSCLNKKGELVADDGTKLSVNDHVYLVCEPPGDPYYVCRIMEFLHVDSDNPNSPVDSIRVNWYYRPRDVQRFSSDTRLVFGTMHSDMCPITSLRGKCMIKHRSEIEDLDAYRKERDSFYFVQVFDRFIRRSYECIPVQQIINVPEKVKKALDERWKFVVVEIGRVKELTSAAKTCKRCARYCASHDSVDCAICKNSYHMNCVQPPLPKKPSRGFAWACGPCSRASERKMNTPSASGNATEVEEDAVDEEEVPEASNDTTRAPSPSGDEMVIDDHPATQAEIALAKMWPMRYLGIHARVEDALQYDDRAIYPRASSRLGPRHQANVNVWHGRPVELVKSSEIKRRYNKGPAAKGKVNLTKETLAAIEADREEKAKRPMWVQDEPRGYVARGEDYDAKDPRCTAKPMFRMPSLAEYPDTVAGQPDEDPASRQEQFIDNYVSRAKGYSRAVGVPPFGTNFLDKTLELLTSSKYNVEAALKDLQKVDRRKDLHEPVLTKQDLVKFEEGVAKYGSEHRLIRLHMKTNLPYADIVRFYYLWKKTPKGREIWGNYGGRKKRKMESDAGARLQAEIANDVDDSAFDNDKALRKNRSFQCKFCSTQHSRQWRRAPGVSPGQMAPADKNATGKEKKDRPLLALCLRCAGLWRKYAIQWEEVEDLSKKVGIGGRTLKKKIDEELLRELIAANEAASSHAHDTPSGSTPGLEGSEPPKKKTKTDKDGGQTTAARKEKLPLPPKEPTPPPPPIIPAQPTWKVLPCSVCKTYGDTIACNHCKLTVHRRCFGLRDNEGLKANGDVKWVCEQCQNDRNPVVSTDYSCCLCLTEETLVDLVEPPKVSHKKKTDREREKERLEKELADGMRADYRSKQLSLNRPVMPREPLKRTTGNNWVHVYCATWAPEVRFSNAKALEVAEGLQMIPQARYEAVCKLCKNKDHQNKFRQNAGACVSCFQCNATFHASCAFEAGYTFGFDVQPVKGSRKDQITTATLGQETGALSAVILCKEHVVKGTIHPMNEVVDEDGTTALQVYAENYKQADLTLTGTVRKAAQAQLTKEKVQQVSTTTAQNGVRRESGAHSIAAAVRRGARSSLTDSKGDGEDGNKDVANGQDSRSLERRCAKCDIDITPKWHPVYKERKAEALERGPSVVAADFQDPGKPHDSVEQVTAAGNSQNIRFMAPGASGRAWEGMPDRYPRPSVGGELSQNDAHLEVTGGTPNREGANFAQPNGEVRPPPDDEVGKKDDDDGYHTHALPRFQNPGARQSPPQDKKATVDELPDEFLCHKCFIKKKLDPTPPPEEGKPLSPPRQYPVQHDILNRSPQPPSQPTIEQQFEVWDRPPPRPTPMPQPPPSLNGLGPAPHYGPHPGPPPHHPYAHPSFGPQPNGFHGGPPGPLHGAPPSMHERHGSYGYPTQASPNPGPHYPPPHQPRAPAMNGYPGLGQPLPNGLPSPRHTLPSPNFPPAPSVHLQQQQQSQLMQAQQVEQRTQLQPLAPPLHKSPTAPFGRPRSEHSNGQPTPFEPSLTPSQQSQPPPQAVATSPPGSAASPRAESAPRPATPRDVPANGPGNVAGASASPNLMNLISH